MGHMDIGWQELAIILLVVIVVFGVGKLPEVGGALGKGIREFRQATHDDTPAQRNSQSAAIPVPINDRPTPAPRDYEEL